MSRVATSTDQPTTGLPLLAKEPRRALQSQQSPDFFLAQSVSHYGSRLLESPWLSECFQDTAAATSGQRPAPNTV